MDAGTGIRSLSERLSSQAFHGSIVLSHLHWDHVEGLPFCGVLDHGQSVVDLYVPAQDGATGRDLLARTMSPPSFPIEPEGLRGTWGFHAIAPSVLKIEGFTITAAEIAHKGGRTLGYRVEDETGSFAYLPDHAPGQGTSAEARAMIDCVDVMLHDAQFVESERAIADDYGHATIDEAIRLADEANVKTLVLFHHSPSRTDAELDLLAPELEAPMPVIIAREGMTIAIP